jgi:tetratricopeptide (TPR) repeat protein
MATYREAHLRHARYFVAKLRAANKKYKQGGEAIMQGLALFDSELDNIRAGQAAAEELAGSDEAAARLCDAYAGAAYLLNIRLPAEERIRWLTAALAACRRLADRAAEVRHLNNLGLAYQELGEFRRAAELYESQAAIARGTGDRRIEGAALCNLGIAYLALGDLHSAVETEKRALSIFRDIGYRRGEADALNLLGFAHADLGHVSSG